MTLDDREYFRVATVAKLSLRAIAPGDEADARMRTRAVHVREPVDPGAIEDSGLSVDARLVVEILRHISVSLDRIERRLGDFVPDGKRASPVLSMQPGRIELSGSGLVLTAAAPIGPGTLVELELDLCSPALPIIPAVGRVEACRSRDAKDPGYEIAIIFDEIHSEDRERIVQFTVRCQNDELRRERSEAAGRVT